MEWLVYKLDGARTRLLDRIQGARGCQVSRGGSCSRGSVLGGLGTPTLEAKHIPLIGFTAESVIVSR